MGGDTVLFHRWGFFHILQTFTAGRASRIAKEYQPPGGIRRKIWQILHLT